MITVNTSLPSFLPSFLPPFHLSPEFYQYTKFHLDGGLCRPSRCNNPICVTRLLCGPRVLRAASWKPAEAVCLCPFWLPLSEGVAVSQKLSVFVLLFSVSLFILSLLMYFLKLQSDRPGFGSHSTICCVTWGIYSISLHFNFLIKKVGITSVPTPQGCHMINGDNPRMVLSREQMPHAFGLLR